MTLKIPQTVGEVLANRALTLNIIDVTFATKLCETTTNGALRDFRDYMTVFTDDKTVARLLREWGIWEEPPAA